jgi:hypothetical protein
MMCTFLGLSMLLLNAVVTRLSPGSVEAMPGGSLDGVLLEATM